MKEFKLDKKYASKIIRESIDKLLKEELGIANDVVMKTNEIKNLIYRDSRNAEKERLDNGVSLVNGKVSINVFDTEMDIFYSIYNYYDFDTYYDKQEYFNPRCSVSYERNEIYLSILSISGEFQENSFGDSIQHELEHLYQIKMQGKGLFQDNNLYDKATKNLNNESFDGWISKLANIIYYSRNEEHDAFVNGLYQQLVSQDAFNRYDYIIKSSTPYQISLLLGNLKNEIENNYNNNNLIEASKFFKKPRRWFIAQCEIGIRKIIKKIMKVRAKANNDFYNVNEGIIFEHDFFSDYKKMNNKLIENYYR